MGSKNLNYSDICIEMALSVLGALNQMVAVLPSLVNCRSLRLSNVIWLDIAYLMSASLFIGRYILELTN